MPIPTFLPLLLSLVALLRHYNPPAFRESLQRLQGHIAGLSIKAQTWQDQSHCPASRCKNLLVLIPYAFTQPYCAMYLASLGGLEGMSPAAYALTVMLNCNVLSTYYQSFC